MIDINNKLTEDETVELLMDFLKSDGYKILDYCKGHKRGIDITAERNNRKLLIEVKGARANHNSKIKKRPYFDSGQIKDHFGKAIVKSLEVKSDYPDCDIAIAHPEDDLIKKHINKSVQHLKKLEIFHFWVSKNGKVIKI
jgi:hypothetical protein|tara:strand:+ start:492 stop:911 length:420 start_codon:yes stop_codon:yes gene_type:complete